MCPKIVDFTHCYLFSTFTKKYGLGDIRNHTVLYRITTYKFVLWAFMAWHHTSKKEFVFISYSGIISLKSIFGSLKLCIQETQALLLLCFQLYVKWFFFQHRFLMDDNSNESEIIQTSKRVVKVSTFNKISSTLIKIPRQLEDLYFLIAMNSLLHKQLQKNKSDLQYLKMRHFTLSRD